MPTNLLKGRQHPKAQPGGELDYIDALIVPPWQGYCPDLNPHLAGFTAFLECQGLVNDDGVLTLDSGWVRLEDLVTPNLTLPLGGHFLVANIPDAPADEGHAQPVVLIAELFRSDGDDELLNIFAATGLSVDPVAVVLGVSHGTSLAGFCWYLDDVDWVNVPFNAAIPVAAAGGIEQAANRDEMFDWAPYPLGGTLAGAHTVRPGLLVFTNREDEVYCWDPEAGGALPGEYTSAYGTALGGARFYAKSVELFDDRLTFLNTNEVGEERYRRFRWTALGNTVAEPFIATIDGVGSGFFDLDEFNGQGLRVLKFKDRAALYFADGVAIVNRTWNVANPFNRQYVSKERGLLGTFAVTRLSNDVHFGVFSDGWYMFDSTGQWHELGTMNIQQGTANKFKRTFYSQIDLTRANEVVVDFDEFVNRVRVAFPITTGNDGADGFTGHTVWIYDVDTDTVWPDQPYNPVIWGNGFSGLTEHYPWNDPLFTDLPEMLWSEAAGRWIDYSASYGTKATLHGDEYGFIYIHIPNVITRDDGNTTQIVHWNFQTHQQAYNNIHSTKTGDRITVRHGTLANDKNISFGYRNETGAEVSESIQLNLDVGGATAVSTVHPTLLGDTLAVIAAGRSAVEIFSFQTTVRSTSGTTNLGPD